MGRHKQINGEFVPAGLAVRHDILKMIFDSPTVPVRLPSALQLAKKHHVSRSTVTTEMKKLIESGWIIGKPGIGSFSNPEKPVANQTVVKKKIIGLLVGDTWFLKSDYTDWAILSYTGLELLPDIGHPKNVILSSKDPDHIYQELNMSILDGLIWLFPQDEHKKVIQKLQQNGKPVITIYNQVPHVPYIEFNHEKIGEDIAAHLMKEKISRIIWGTLEDPNPDRVLHGAKKYWKKHVQKMPEITVLERRYSAFEQLEGLFKSGEIPEAIFVHSDFLSSVRFLMEKHSLSDRVLLITSYGHIRKEKDFRGIVYKHDFQKMGMLAAQYMQKLLNGEKNLVPLKTSLVSEVFYIRGS